MRALAYPVKLKTRSLLLGCDAVVVYGYRAQAGDVWRGPTRRKMREARADARTYNHQTEAR